MRSVRARCGHSASAGAPIGWSTLGVAILTGVVLAARAHAFDTTSTRFDWVLAVKGLLVGLLVAGAYLHDFVLGPGARAPDPGRRAAVAAADPDGDRPCEPRHHGCAPVLGVLLSEFLPRLSPGENGVAVHDDFDLAALIALRRARQRRRRPRGRRLLLIVFLVAVAASSSVLAGAAVTGRALVFSSCDLLAPPGRARLELVPLRLRRQPARRHPVEDEPPAAELEKMSPWLPKATVAIEDSRFWQHGALDYQGIARALYKDVSAGTSSRAARRSRSSSCATSTSASPSRRCRAR